jgi:hypothetical protein
MNCIWMERLWQSGSKFMCNSGFPTWIAFRLVPGLDKVTHMTHWYTNGGRLLGCKFFFVRYIMYRNQRSLYWCIKVLLQIMPSPPVVVSSIFVKSSALMGAMTSSWTLDFKDFATTLALGHPIVGSCPSIEHVDVVAVSQRHPWQQSYISWRQWAATLRHVLAFTGGDSVR